MITPQHDGDSHDHNSHLLTVRRRCYIKMSGCDRSNHNFAGTMDFDFINLDELFPNLEHQPMRYVLHVCGLRDIPSQTRLIEFEGLEEIEELANYTDAELDTMADRNSKRSPAATRVQMGLARTKKLKAVKFWINKKLRENAACDLTELTDALIGELIREMSLTKSDKDSDSKLYYPDAFNANDYKKLDQKGVKLFGFEER